MCDSVKKKPPGWKKKPPGWKSNGSDRFYYREGRGGAWYRCKECGREVLGYSCGEDEKRMHFISCVHYDAIVRAQKSAEPEMVKDKHSESAYDPQQPYFRND